MFYFYYAFVTCSDSVEEVVDEGKKVRHKFDSTKSDLYDAKR